MSTAWWMHRLSDAIFIVVLPLDIFRFIKNKTFWKWWTIMAAFDAIAFGMQEHWGRCAFNWLMTVVFYWFWKKSPDDDDRPKKKRAALKSKFDKFLPKPVDTPVHVPS